jgi:predicted DNA-binding transcriptional regulator YafY
VATARRDLEALSAAGVPVYPQAGRGGGWSLVGGARTDLSGLTAAEARALFLLAGPVRSAPLASALRKLVRALPETFRADASAAADAVVVDPARWGERDRDRPPLVDALQDAVVRRRRVEIDYRAHGRRAVDPWGLVVKDDVWHLIGDTDKGQRTFRVDRIAQLAMTETGFERPTDFDLTREWDRVVDEMEQRRSLLSATVLISARLAPVLCDRFGRHSEQLDTLDDGRVRLRVTAPAAVSIAQELAGWGALVEVVEPDAVRNELARLGSELVARYSPTAHRERPGSAALGVGRYLRHQNSAS